MATQQQKKAQARKQLIERRIVIAAVAVLFLGTAVVLWILNGQGIIQGSWSNLFSIIFVFASVLIGLFQWLFPVVGSPSEHHSPATPPPAPGMLAPSQSIALPLAPVLPTPPVSNGEKVVY